MPFRAADEQRCYTPYAAMPRHVTLILFHAFYERFSLFAACRLCHDMLRRRCVMLYARRLYEYVDALALFRLPCRCYAATTPVALLLTFRHAASAAAIRVACFRAHLL